MVSTPCHPPPTKPCPAGDGASSEDPYQALGLDHNATAAQIKTAYRKLALKYHPDRQQQQSPTPISDGGSGQSSSTPDNDDAAAAKRGATDKFTSVSAAYATLSDPVKKKEYDHLYKFGAFDDNHGHGQGAKNTTTSNYQYTEDYSGGYYKPGYVPQPASSAPRVPSYFAAAAQRAAAAATFQSMQSQDSFFDDLIYSPKSSSQQKNQSAFFDDSSRKHDNNDPFSASNQNGDTSNNNTQSSHEQKKQPGIGFSLKPLGKHLSVHVPSKNEIMTNMTREAMDPNGMPREAHLFGTRVTFSQQTTSGLGKLDRFAEAACGTDTTVAASCDSSSSKIKEKKVVCQTTRIAKGQKRMVKRTAHLRTDGTKEVVIEENGAVIRRYVEEAQVHSTTGNSASNSQDKHQTRQHGDDQSKQHDVGEDEGGLQKEDEEKFSLLGIFKSCLAPCTSINAGG